jgi:COG4 transport protein
MDDLVNNYIVLEKLHLRNAFIKGLTSDNTTYVKVIAQKLTQNGDKPFSQASEILDFVDDLFYILDASAKRVSSLFFSHLLYSLYNLSTWS